MRPQLSIAIVLHNSRDSLAACLDSVRAAVTSGLAEVIVVDNASPDDSVEILQRELPAARLLRLEENSGFAAGANTALARATSRYWMLLNPDVRVPPTGLATLVGWMDAHADVAAASPEIWGEDGTWESPGRPSPSILRLLLELSRLHRLLPRELRGRILRGPYWPGGDQAACGWVPGTAMIVRSDAARQVGLMREDLFMYGEDIEWCWRMRRAGWRIGVCASTTFIHNRSSSARRSFGQEGKDHRTAAGVDAACRSMHGVPRARVLAALTALGLALEACPPRRTREHRATTLRLASIWWELAARRGLPGAQRDGLTPVSTSRSPVRQPRKM